MNKRGFIAIVFVIGCATGGVASQFAVPPARAGTTPTRWEYLCSESKAGISSQLNKAGAEGWELVSVFASNLDHQIDGSLRGDLFAFCLKRALP